MEPQPIPQQHGGKADDEIDSALCAGMKDPRERAALFRLEHEYIEFCNSPSLWMDVGGSFNRFTVPGPPAAGGSEHEQQMQQQAYAAPISPQFQQGVGGYQTSFHRLLVHRLADRFNIQREARTQNFIRLIKSPESRVPSVLLKDLDPNVYYPVDPNDTYSNSNNNTNNGMYNSNDNGYNMNNNVSINQYPSANMIPSEGGSSPAEKKQQKKIIMKKRSPGSEQSMLQKKNSRSSDGGASAEERQSDYATSRSSSSEHLEAKEKAYAEARARIFNDGEGGPNEDAATEPSSPSESPASEDCAPVAAMSNLSIQSETGNSDENSNSPNSTIQNSNSAEFLSPSSSTDAADRKAVYRNRAEEAADPDFRRGRIRHQSSPASYNAQGVFYPPAPPQQQQQPQAPLNSQGAATASPSTASKTLTASAPVFVPGSGAGGGKPFAPSKPHATSPQHQYHKNNNQYHGGGRGSNAWYGQQQQRHYPQQQQQHYQAHYHQQQQQHNPGWSHQQQHHHQNSYPRSSSSRKNYTNNSYPQRQQQAQRPQLTQQGSEGFQPSPESVTAPPGAQPLTGTPTDPKEEAAPAAAATEDGTN